MQKFENVDVIAALSEIMRQNTAFYQSDFDIDKGIIQRAAASDQAVDKTLLWMSRPSGTYCFRERDVFLKDTRQHNTWRFYGEQTRDKILAYAVELTDTKDDTIRGNLYELDYQQHFRHVIDAALPMSVSRLFYEHGSRDIPAEQYFDGSPDRALGSFSAMSSSPATRLCCRRRYSRSSADGSRQGRGISRPISPLCTTAGLKPRHNASWIR